MTTYAITHEVEIENSDDELEFDHIQKSDGFTQEQTKLWLSQNVKDDMLYQYYITEYDEDGDDFENVSADAWMEENE